MENSVENKNNNNKKAKIKNVIDWVINGILVFLTVLVGYYFIQVAIIKTPTPSLFGYSYYYVETGSMEDYISIGDVIIVKKTNDYEVDDVITFIQEGDKIVTTHRVMEVHDSYYITKGDANNIEDKQEVYDNEVVGEVIHIIKDGGAFVKWLSQENGFMYILAMLIVLIGGISILFKKDDKDKKEIIDEKEDS